MAAARIEAVKRLGRRQRHEAFSHACRPGEDQTGRNRVALDGTRQQRDKLPMTDDVSKRHIRPTRRIVSLLSGFVVVVRAVLAAENPPPEPTLLLGRVTLRR